MIIRNIHKPTCRIQNHDSICISYKKYEQIYEFDLEKVGRGQRSCDNRILHPHEYTSRTENHVSSTNSLKVMGTK